MITKNTQSYLGSDSKAISNLFCDTLLTLQMVTAGNGMLLSG